MLSPTPSSRPWPVPPPEDRTEGRLGGPYPCLLPLGRHLAKDRIVLQPLETACQSQRPLGRYDGGEHVRLLDPPEHRRLAHPVFFQCLDQFIELPDLDPVDAIDVPFKLGRSLSDMGDR